MLLMLNNIISFGQGKGLKNTKAPSGKGSFPWRGPMRLRCVPTGRHFQSRWLVVGASLLFRDVFKLLVDAVDVIQDFHSADFLFR